MAIPQVHGELKRNKKSSSTSEQQTRGGKILNGIKIFLQEVTLLLPGHQNKQKNQD